MMGINAKTLPGILLCAILAIPCWLLGQHFHFIGSPIFAIILGIIIGSLFTSWKREKTGAGIGFTSKKILQWAVILLGFGLNITQVLHVGWVSLPIIISTIATSLIISYIIFKATHIDSNTAVLCTKPNKRLRQAITLNLLILQLSSLSSFFTLSFVLLLQLYCPMQM